ncbi:MAG: hypothetical protein NTX86_05700 [Candidatus Dependentiae bacterium]|nr:hypothetical protein [Candidatus Dependentiae bacterium]
MKSKNNIALLISLSIGGLFPQMLQAENAVSSYKKKNKIHGLLSSLSDSPTAETLSTLQEDKQANLATQLDTLDAQSAPASIAAPAVATTSAAQSIPASVATPLSITPAPEKTTSAGPAPIVIPAEKTVKNATEIKTDDARVSTLVDQTPIKPASAKKSKSAVKINPEDMPYIEFQFENTDLQNVISQVGEIFKVSFIMDEMIDPLPTGAKAIKGNKVSFKTQKPLTKKQGWNLFLSFLDVARFAVIPQADPTFFKITSTEAAKKSALRSFIGVDSALLPDTDETIRYVYFIENSSVEAIKGIVDSLKPNTSPLQILQESKAFILTDKSYNIKSIMEIVKELDKVSMPQALSVLKLRWADANDVKTLYEGITKQDDASITSRLFPARKQPSSLYFPENTRIFAEPRTNTLILMGTQDAIKKIEDFILKHIDVDIDRPYSPLKVYQLKYADATTVAQIMNDVTGFGKSTAAGTSGSVRGGDKYFKTMNFTPETSTNRIIVGSADNEDYLKAVEIMKKLDAPQPQVAMEVLILAVSLQDNKELGSQLRSKVPGPDGLVGKNVKFQTSGLFAGGVAQGIVENPNGPGVQRLLGNLINLVQGAPAGNTVLSLGADVFGVWGIFQALQTVANLEVVSNPFLTTSNNTAAFVEVGETRRVVSGNVLGGGTDVDTFANQSANLRVDVTPQINSDGMIVLKLKITIDEFLNPDDPRSATLKNKLIETSAIVADKEVLALGGLVQNKISNNMSKVPILGDIPLLGWLFKNKRKTQTKENLLVLISTRIIDPLTDASQPATQEKIKDYHNSINEMEDPTNKRDPIHRMFFANSAASTDKIMDEYMFKRHDAPGSELIKENKTISRAKRRKEERKQKKLAQAQEQNQQQQPWQVVI